MNQATKNIDISSFKRYIEPLVGSGKSLLSFCPETPCYINDPDTDSANFFRNINNPDLIKELELFSINWHILKVFCNMSVGEIFMVYSDYYNGIISSEDISFMIRAILMMNMEDDSYQSLIGNSFAVSYDMLSNSWVQSIENTLIRLKSENEIQVTDKPDEAFSIRIENSIKRGFFNHMSNLINLQNTGLIECLEENKRLATLFFLKCCSKEKQLSFDKKGNLKLQFDKTDECASNFSNCYKMFFEGSLKNINITSVENKSYPEFLSDLSPDMNDIIVFNIIDRLHSGKTTRVNKNELMELVKKTNSNIIIVTDEANAATEFQEENGFEILETENVYVLKNF